MWTDADGPLDGAHPDACPVCGTAALAAPGPDPSAGEPCPVCGHLLWFTSHRVGDVTVVRLVDSRAAVLEMLDLLDNAVGEGSVGKVVLDLGGLPQVSSAALGKLVKLRDRAHAVRGRLALCGLHADVRHVLRLTQLDRYFETHPTETEALAALGVGAVPDGDTLAV